MGDDLPLPEALFESPEPEGLKWFPERFGSCAAMWVGSGALSGPLGTCLVVVLVVLRNVSQWEIPLPVTLFYRCPRWLERIGAGLGALWVVSVTLCFLAPGGWSHLEEM